MRYKTAKGFEFKDVAGDFILIPRGASTIDQNCVMVFNEAGALIYNAMNDYISAEELAQLLVDKYSIGFDEALADTNEYIEKMLENKVIEQEN